CAGIHNEERAVFASNGMARLGQGVGLCIVMCLILVVGGVARGQEAKECEAGSRLFDHALLVTDPVWLPDNPQRVVALDLTAAEPLLFTDKDLVGTFDWIVLDLAVTMPPLEDDLAATTQLGWPANLEAILELKPDLIAAYVDDSLVYDELSAIAP